MRTRQNSGVSLALTSLLALAALGCGAGEKAADQSVALEDPDKLVHYVEPVATPAGVAEAIAAGATSQVAAQPITTESDVDIATIINIGKEVWAIIEKNQPVVNISYDYANALPKGVASPSDLDGFSDMVSQSYRMYGKNLYGMTVYDVTYTVVHQYGGSYQGKGRYLATAAVIPSNVDVLWGYKVDLKVTNVSTLNVGTATAPVGSINLELSFKVSTVIKSHTTTTLFQFRGDSADVNSSDL